MLELNNVTLIAVSDVNIEDTIKALEYSCRDIKFACVKFVSYHKPNYLPSYIDYIPDTPTGNIDNWNYKMVYELGGHVDTEFAMLIHSDGFIVNPDQWRSEFLEYDYIGAPWSSDNHLLKDINGEQIRVGNSVSIRSKKLMDLPKKIGMEWRAFNGYTNEDGWICINNRHIFKENGMKFADIDIAKYFAHEAMIPEIVGIKPFAFHRWFGTNSIYPKFN
jgi:hypothetical protein